MEIEVFSFSGTGNSLSVARDLASTMNGRQRSLSSVVRSQAATVWAETIVVVFPAYLAQKWGVPSIVADFVRRIDDLRSKRVFAVCTCGGFELVNAVPALRNFSKILKGVGGTLAGGYSIKLPMNNLKYPSRLIGQDFEAMYSESRQRIGDIGARIVKGRRDRHHFRNRLLDWLLIPAYLALQNLYVEHVRAMAKEPRGTQLGYFDLIKRTDRSIVVEASCTGCGTCVRVCPAGNIALQSSRPLFLHRCEMCLACDEWCPSRSIRHWCKTEGKNYHHPTVGLSDMLGATKGET